jgi:hypothetical protein
LKTNFSILKVVCRKLAFSLLLASSAIGAFATLGDGKANKTAPKVALLSFKSNIKPGSFSLQSGYTFRGNQVMAVKETKYINLASTAYTYQQGHTTYTIPLQKKVSVSLTSQNQVKGATINIQF